jgi:hypothetical protein
MGNPGGGGAWPVAVSDAIWHNGTDRLPQGGFVRNNNGRAVVPKTKPKLQLSKKTLS